MPSHLALLPSTAAHAIPHFAAVPLLPFVSFHAISSHFVSCHFVSFHVISYHSEIPSRSIPCHSVLFGDMPFQGLGHFCHCHCVLFSTSWSFLSLSLRAFQHALVIFVIVILGQVCHCHCVLFSTSYQICHRHCWRARLGQVRHYHSQPDLSLSLRAFQHALSDLSPETDLSPTLSESTSWSGSICHCHWVLFSTPCQICHRHCHCKQLPCHCHCMPLHAPFTMQLPPSPFAFVIINVILEVITIREGEDFLWKNTT